MFYFLMCLLLLVVIVYGLFWPRTNAIYKGDNGEQVRVLNFNWNTIVIQYVEYDPDTDVLREITGPQNIGLFEFLKMFNLWIML